MVLSPSPSSRSLVGMMTLPGFSHLWACLSPSWVSPSHLHHGSTRAPQLTSLHPCVLQEREGPMGILNNQVLTACELTWEYLPQIRGLKPLPDQSFFLLGCSRGEGRWSVLY